MTNLLAASAGAVLCVAGSYTNPEHPNGVNLFSVDPVNGKFVLTDSVNAGRNTTYMALTRDCSRLYLVAGDDSFGLDAKHDGGLVAYRIEGTKLVKTSSLALDCPVPCHISLSPDEKSVVWAEYGDANCGTVDLDGNGDFLPLTLRKTKHAGVTGPNKPRQNAPHAHFAAVTPDSKYLLVVDLGMDEIKAYDFSRRAEGMIEVPSVSLKTIPAGAGPRHFVFSKDGKFMYVLFELGNLVATYSYSGNGFKLLDSHSTLPEGFTGTTKAAAIKLSEDGRQLFASNRGYDSIAVFDVNAAGTLTKRSVCVFDGKFPRDFEFAPGGKVCMVGLKESWKVESCIYDAEKGVFTPVQTMENMYRPLYFKFLSAVPRD